MSTGLSNSASLPGEKRPANHLVAGKRRAVSCTLRSVERSLSAILGAVELREYFPGGYHLEPSCRYIRSLRHASRGMLSDGKFWQAFLLLDRALSVALEDSFVLSSALQKVPDLQILVANLDRDVRLFEAAFSVLKQTIRSEFDLQ